MSFLKKIEEERNQARINDMSGDRYKGLTFLLSEVRKVGKDADNRDPTDEEVVKVCKKLITTSEEMLVVVKNQRDFERFKGEVELYSEFIPQQVSEEELEKEIQKMIEEKGLTSMKEMGILMKGLKEKFGTSLDGKMAANLVKERLGR